MLNAMRVIDYSGSSALREEGKQAANQALSVIEGIDEQTKESHAGFI